MGYYLILDNDYETNLSVIDIIDSSSKLDDLRAVTNYNPTEKTSIPAKGLHFIFKESHNLQNSLTGHYDPASIYQA